LMNADPGALNPYAVIGDPRREHYVREDGTSDEVAWARAVRGIEATRRRLCVDTLMALLPLPLLQDPHTHIAVTDAARRVRAVRTASPRQVIAELGKLDGSLTEHGGFLARTLDDLAEQPQTQLIFPAAEGADMIRDDLVLQVLTMRGNVLPDPAKPRDEWTIAETVGMPLMTLAATLTQQHVYSGSMDERKLVIMDEVDQLLRVSVGQAVTRQLCRDTRKHNTRAILCGQNTSDSLAAGIENFVDNAFVGRTEGEAEQASALQTLGVQRGIERRMSGPARGSSCGKTATVVSKKSTSTGPRRLQTCSTRQRTRGNCPPSPGRWLGDRAVAAVAHRPGSETGGSAAAGR
jgi:hypothetical protein